MKRSIHNIVAVKLADILCTMAMFYGVTIFTLSILCFQTPRTPLEWVQYSIQTFFQGVALPVLGLVGKINGERQEKLLQETHDAVMEEMRELKILMGQVHKIALEERKIETQLDM
jgi:hypothetical protein